MKQTAQNKTGEQHGNLLKTAGEKKLEQNEGKKFANESAPSLYIS